MKFSEVTRLLLRTAWMGSTPSQSLQGSPWPASRPFPWNLSPPWFLALPDHVISFWKAFDEANKMVQEDFWFSARIKSCGCRGGDLEGGKFFFWELCNIYKIEYFWNQILWDACFFVFWFEPPRGGAGGHCISIFSIEIQTADRYWWNLASRWSLRVRRFLGGFNTVPPHPQVQGAKGGTGCLWSLSRAFWQKLYKTKVAGRPWFSRGGSPFWAPNPDLEGPGPHVLLETWSLTMKGTW